MISSRVHRINPLNRPKLSFLAGLIIGFSAATLLGLLKLSETKNNWIQFTQLISVNNSLLTETTIDENDQSTTNISSSKYILKNDSISVQLQKEIKILCWVQSHPNNHKTRLPYLKKTWGKRCNKLLLISSKEDPEIGTISVPFIGNETHDLMWNKTREAFEYVYKNYYNEYDWFLKTDDDTYVIMENLRFLLRDYSTEEPIQFGCRFHDPEDLINPKYEYISGSAIVLSKEALKRFVVEALPNPELCSIRSDAEDDVELGVCLHNFRVQMGDARDEFGGGRFFPFAPKEHLIPNYNAKSFWYWQYRVDGTPEETWDIVSNTTISFHYITGEEMIVFDYLLYNASVFGISENFKLFDKKILNK